MKRDSFVVLTFYIRSICLPAFLVIAAQAETNSVADADAAYTRAITQRADKIVATLSIVDTNKFIRVRDIITRQYRDLSKIHDLRDANIKRAKERTGADKNKDLTDKIVQAWREDAELMLDKLHIEFLSRLSVELASEQVEKVKDGLTYGVAPNIYAVYLKMYPELTDEQKKQIMAWLVEAREIAMDGSTAEEKHAVFGKYKGKINNYLSKAGYDAKKGEQNLKKAAAPPPPKLN